MYFIEIMFEDESQKWGQLKPPPQAKTSSALVNEASQAWTVLRIKMREKGVFTDLTDLWPLLC